MLKNILFGPLIKYRKKIFGMGHFCFKGAWTEGALPYRRFSEKPAHPFTLWFNLRIFRLLDVKDDGSHGGMEVNLLLTRACAHYMWGKWRMPYPASADFSFSEQKGRQKSCAYFQKSCAYFFKSRAYFSESKHRAEKSRFFGVWLFKKGSDKEIMSYGNFFQIW